ncbi:amino acid permease [Roseiarcaceae bacterium H3SJ34-1]|uniref:APC family permease n=1 Tax=Terripilifer ovatus TaxID=3032367 RepID=UPI003AB92666|nr:amino acid permease [Roseiarcaceae bacterium H3SJ34-1]
MDSPPNRPQLVRSLSLGHSVLYGLGVTIGAGIYVLVGLAAGRSGLHAPLAFVIAAVLLLFSAASFAELGTRMPVSASEAAYVDAAFTRDWLTLTVGLLVIITASISAATISVGSAGYISVFVPLPLPVLITGVVLLMGFIACLATVQSVTFAGIMTLIEVGGLLLIIGAGVLAGPQIITRLPEAIPPFTVTAWTGVAGTALVAVFAFIGFEHLVNVSEEMKQPRLTLPRALFLTLGITAILYALIIWIAVIAVPPAELSKSSAPLALVFERLTGMPLVTMGGIAVVATLNGVIVHMIMIARVMYGLANDGRLPKALAAVNARTRTPVLATVIGIIAILVLALAVPLSGLADLTARATLAIFSMVNLALIRIRLREIKPPDDIFLCPLWMPYVGLTSSVLLFVASFVPHG